MIVQKVPTEMHHAHHDLYAAYWRYAIVDLFILSIPRFLCYFAVNSAFWSFQPRRAALGGRRWQSTNRT